MFKYVLPASLLLSVPAMAQVQVVTSVKPVSMIVSAIGGEHIKVEQLVTNQASPHDFAMRPSDLRKLNQAELVVWVGESLETFLEKPLGNLSDKKDLEWMALNDAFLREFGDKEAHDHPGHDHSMAHDEHHDEHEHDEHHDEHEHDEHDEHHEEHEHDEHHDEHEHDEHHDEHEHDEHHDEHEHDEHHDEHEHDEHGHEGHDHSGTDPHVWLDPVNAQVLARAVKERLIDLDPEHKQAYQSNYQAFISSVEHADHDVSERLAEVAKVPYFVFHEAYGYFENHYGMSNQGAIAVSPERKPGAKTIAHIREEIEEHNVACVFSEPQFSPAIVATLIEGTSVKTAVLDPLGTDIDLGPDSYAMFLTGLADQYLSCLK